MKSNPSTEPVLKHSCHESPRSAQDWLDALADGACDQRAFLSGVGELLRNAPDAVWELLAYVDQYYRRGKLSAETFGTLKAHLQGILVGNDTSVPWPRLREDPATAVAPTAVASTAVAPTPAAPTAVAPTAAARTAAARTAVASNTVASSSVAATAVASAAERHASAFARAAAAAPAVSRIPTAPVPHTAASADRRASRPQRTLAVGDVLRGRYRIQGLLGRGGMGTVFAATDQYRLDGSNGDQRVAIKVLHTEVVNRPRLFAELRREFQYLQALSHPNIVRVHEFDRDGDLAFFTMEYLHGVMLSRVLAGADAPALHRPYAFAIIRDVGAAVAHAHARGVVHGDLNPGNIFITDDGEIRVLDFGASHPLQRAPWISEFDNHRQMAVATPSYASCQLLEGEVADARDDVYALACIAYLLLSGNHPFGNHTALKARTRRLSPARPEGLTRGQWNTLREGLHFDRERRPVELGSWLARIDLRAASLRLPELQSLWAPRPRRRRLSEWIAVGVVALCAAGGWFAVTNRPTVERGVAAIGAGIESLVARAKPLRPRGDVSVDGGQSAREVPVTAPATAAAAPRPRTPDPSRASATTPGMHGNAAADPAATAYPEATSKPPPITNPEAPAKPAATANTQTTAKPPASAKTSAIAGTAAAFDPTTRIDRPAASSSAQASKTGQASITPSAPGALATVPSGVPRARIELAEDNVDVTPAEDTAHIVVRRSRALREDVSFTWWTESGTAKPGRDFVPVKATVEHIENGKNSVSLAVPLVAQSAQRPPRSFYVVIDEPSDNAALGTRTLTMVTLPGSD